MSSQGDSGIKIADAIQIWIGVAITLTAIFTWLTYRLQRGGFLLSVPHLTASWNNYDDCSVVILHLQGAGFEQWKIVEVVIASPKSARILEHTTEYDAYGGGVICTTGKALGRRAAYSGGVAISRSDGPVKLRVKLALKAAPSVTSWRTTIINIKD